MTDKLREAAQMALDALEEFCEHGAILRPLERRDALRAALAQPEQEPQETIAKWIKANTEHKQWYICPKCNHQTPRWKDEWVGLTDEERQECLYSDPIFGMATSTFAHAIEAKLKEKNGG